MRDPILITGAAGQVGRELVRWLAPLGKVVAPTHGELSLQNEASLRAFIRTVRPRWIVNAAAYTAVDKAEAEPELAFAVNATAVGVLAEEAREIGAAMLHYSTDYVFDGLADRPYVETDIPAPLNVYGASKLEGECRLAESGVAYIIFRTSWVFSGQGTNFLLTMLRLARERKIVRVVADQHGAPTWSRELALLTAQLIKVCEQGSVSSATSAHDALAPHVGLYHAASAGETTWHGFAEEAVRSKAEARPGVKFASLEPIPSTEYPAAAQRPANSRLNCTKLAERLNWHMPTWQDSLRNVLAEM